MHPLAAQILTEMQAIATADKRARQEPFFKEPVNLIGLMMTDIRNIVHAHRADMKWMRREDVFAVAGDLMTTGYWEAVAAGALITYAVRRKFQKSDFKIFESWMNKYITNWANCDEFCNHTMNAIVEMYPDLIQDIQKWTKSPNRWVRRGAAVTFILSARHGRFMDEVFNIADTMLTDDDEMVLKGYGWALKVAGEFDPMRVYDFIAARRDKMPRIAFRYAIEKFPPELRQRAMAL